ncbi:MAG: ACT domain-containing protein [Candidatus Methylacidiphilales bacterium]
MAMHIAKQISVFLANKPGTLAAICDVLAEAQINIYAISTSDTIDHSVVRLVVDHPQRALQIFERHGSLVVVTDVLLIDGSNQPGSLLLIAKALAEADINIEYCYCATSPLAKKGLMIMRTSNVEKSLRVLNGPTSRKPTATARKKNGR